MSEGIIPLLGYREEDDDDDDDDDEGEEPMEDEASNSESHNNARPVSYDTSLPAQHSYLGTDLEEVSGRTMLDDNSCQNLPLLTLPGVVLIPGQTLPLQLFQPNLVSMMKRIIENDHTFGMVTSRYNEAGSVATLAPIGTTGEIRSYREESSENDGIDILRVKAEGRQRFEVLSTWRQSDGILMGKVRILPEVILPDPGEGARLPSLDRHRLPPPFFAMNGGEKKLVPVQSATGKPSSHKYNKQDFANYTWWPPWVYKQYDPGVLMQKICEELAGWNQSVARSAIPRNPVEFSFWVAANLPLDDSLRLNLLVFDSSIQRLRCELSILQKYTTLCCKECSSQIADRSDVFSMSREGPLTTYVNPSGYVHDTITLYKARGLNLIGAPSTENSWFPGYAWTIAQCRRCRSHMGWMFTTKNSELQPSKFWGLCRSSLYPDLKSSEEHDEQWLPHV